MAGGPRLNGWERFLLFLPIPGAVAFGLGPFLFPATLPHSVGFAGDDQFVLRLAGGGTFAFAISLGLAVMQGEWLPPRIVVFPVGVWMLVRGPLLARPQALTPATGGPAAPTKPS